MSFHTVSPMFQALATARPCVGNAPRIRSATCVASRADAIPQRDADPSFAVTASLAEGVR